MPLYKYRSASDMPRPERASDAELPARIRSVWGRAFLLCPAVCRPGVRRFRSMEEANEDRLRETVERMRRRAASG
jgi:hypothetical protein